MPEKPKEQELPSDRQRDEGTTRSQPQVLEPHEDETVDREGATPQGQPERSPSVPLLPRPKLERFWNWCYLKRNKWRHLLPTLIAVGTLGVIGWQGVIYTRQSRIMEDQVKNVKMAERGNLVFYSITIHGVNEIAAGSGPPPAASHHLRHEELWKDSCLDQSNRFSMFGYGPVEPSSAPGLRQPDLHERDLRGFTGGTF